MSVPVRVRQRAPKVYINERKNIMQKKQTTTMILNNKKTSIGRRNIKFSSMNKSKKRSYKKYRGQG